VAIGEGRTVQAVLDRRDLPEFDGCRSLRALVDAELVYVREPLAVISAARVEESDATTAESDGPNHDGLGDRGPWTTSELAELTHNGANEESDADADPDAPQPVKRGLLLKFLSSVGS
jgi:hypothetical protein